MNSPHRNLAARAGHWSATHRKIAIGGWIVFVVFALFVGGAVGTKNIKDEDAGVGESKTADQVLADAFPKASDETYLVQSENVAVTDPRFEAVVTQAVRKLNQVPGVRNVQSPYDGKQAGAALKALEQGKPAATEQIAQDGSSALIDFELPAASSKAEDVAVKTLALSKQIEADNPGFFVGEFGDASANKEIGDAFENDFKKAEYSSLPITIIILVLAFGALVAAGVPLLLGATAVAAAIGLLGVVSHVFPVDEAASSVVLLIGLAVGVDYSMFYLRREREERARGRGKEAALDAAAATSGRAVLVSGITVMIAMSGMYLAGASTFTSFATGTMLVVAIAVLGSLTVLPAVLAALGDRVNKGRVPFLKSPQERVATEPRIWSALLDRVLRRPLVSALAATAFLLVLAIPTLSITLAVPGVDSLPKDLQVIQTYDRIQAVFPGNQIPAQIAVQAPDVTAPEVKAATSDLIEQTKSDADLYGQPVTIDVSNDNTVAEIDVPLAGDGTDATSKEALAKLRDEILPSTYGQVTGVTTHVTGLTAGTQDFNDLMAARVPVVFAFVLSAAFLLLLVTFRSIVIPIKAIILNLLSVSAAYGVVTWIFQEGHLQNLLGFNSTGAVTSWLPLFLFVVLFGLSMDYHVFILSRVREAYDDGMTTEEAVAHGIKSTASVVTAAAIVMVAVFSIFATLSMVEFKQFGVGLGMAILIDATIIRGVLLPATMTLLGDWNWYLPRWLEWLPRVSPERGAFSAPPAEVEAATDRAAPSAEREREPAGV